MIQKIFLLKNKFIIILLSIIFAIFIAFFYINKSFNHEYFINKLEEKSGFIVKDKGYFKITFFPEIRLLQKNLKLERKEANSEIILREIELLITKKYLSLPNTNFIIDSPSAVINGIPLRNLNIQGNHNNSNIQLLNLKTNINEGLLNLSGNIYKDKKNNINLKGNISNISITTLLNQNKKINWDRLELKINSNFNIESNGNNYDEYIKNLRANIPINGLFYINSTPEERFGTALLNALTEKIPELSGISQSLDFLFSKYADIPSRIEGLIKINNGILKSEELLILNENAKMKVEISYDLIKDNIDGILSFYKNEEIYLNAKLKGSISEPQILVGGKSFLKKDGKESLQDLKKIIEDGITSIFQKILEE